MHLHLLIPGLMQLPADGLRLPALALMLGRARLAWGPGLSLEAWLARGFGLDADSAPYAALRLLGEPGLAPGHPQPLSHEGRGERSESQRDRNQLGTWLCADPVQLRFTSQGLMLGDASGLDLGEAEAEALIAGLNREFSELGQFHAGSPTRWYLRPARSSSVSCHRLGEVVGRRVDAFLPEGADGPLWCRHFNDIQVFLHGHPVNQAREVEGHPAVNSVWFWGHGPLPVHTDTSFAALAGGDALARGLARAAGIPVLPWAGEPPSAPEGNVLVVADALARPALYVDEEAWREALVALESSHLAPALTALKSGRLESLTLTGLGDRASLELRLTRPDLWKFWRSSVELRELKIASDADADLAHRINPPY
ncbi:MAG: hypothetical protein PHU46_05330 [Rhodocyclaceae bacterium]|nr:hypothetical protein [Rhodocyclaceae bacterium]